MHYTVNITNLTRSTNSHRPGSIRPSHRDEDYETEKLGMPRHKYVDPDFAMTREEEMQKVRADNKYLQFIRTSYENRIRKKDTLLVHKLNYKDDFMLLFTFQMCAKFNCPFKYYFL